MKVEEYLRKKGFEYRLVKRPSGLNAVMNCPFCGDSEEKFAINIESGAFKCLHENKCGRTGSFYQFQTDLGDKPERETRYYDRARKRPDYKKPEVKAHKVTSDIGKFFENRKISQETMKFFRIGKDENGNMLFPYFKNGEVVNVKHRSLDKKFFSEKNAEPVLFNRDNIKSDELIITEGEIDAMTFHEYGYEAVSVPSGVNDLRWIENEWEWLEKYSVIYLCLDMDTAGEKAVDEIVKRLGRWRCYRVALPEKDINDCLMKGRDWEQIAGCIAEAKSYDLEEITRPNFFADAIKEIERNPEKLHGIKTGIPKLDEMLKGWREGEVTVWTGYSGAGKTTLLNCVALNIIEKAMQAVCVCSLEMPMARLLRWLMKQKVGPLTEEKIDEIADELESYLFLVNQNNIITDKKLFEIFEFTAKKYGVKYYIVDSLMKIDLGSDGYDELRYQKRFMNNMTEFARKYSAHVHLVAHPRKGSADESIPGKMDISGTVDIANLAHNVITMWRPSGEKRDKLIKNRGYILDAVLYLKKNREFGTEGRIDMRFDGENRRYVQA
jgi:twinkle protein